MTAPVIINEIDNPRMRDAFHPGAMWRADGSSLTGVVVHWAEEHTPDNLAPALYLDRIEAIAKYHISERDWSGNFYKPTNPGFIKGFSIMYHWVITPTGLVYATAPTTLMLWHAFSPFNEHALAICMLAGPGNTATSAATAALNDMLNSLTNDSTLPHLNRVLYHDEALLLEGRKPKGCCGCYEQAVKDWRLAHPAKKG